MHPITRLPNITCASECTKFKKNKITRMHVPRLYINPCTTLQIKAAHGELNLAVAEKWIYIMAQVTKANWRMTGRNVLFFRAHGFPCAHVDGSTDGSIFLPCWLNFLLVSQTAHRRNQSRKTRIGSRCRPRCFLWIMLHVSASAHSESMFDCRLCTYTAKTNDMSIARRFPITHSRKLAFWRGGSFWSKQKSRSIWKPNHCEIKCFLR